MTKRPLRVAIVGGGPAGLTAAHFLVRAGIDVKVYEQATGPQERGAGIGLFPNCVKVLLELGLGRDLFRRGARQPGLEIVRWEDASVLSSLDYGPFRSHYGAAQVTIHRAHLVEVLREAMPPGVVHHGHCFAGLHQDAAGVEIEFENGARVFADMVFGADGIRTRVGAAVGLSNTLTNQHYAAYRRVIPIELLRDVPVTQETRVWVGPGRHFAHFWVDGGAALNAVGYVSMDRGPDEPWTMSVSVQEWLDQYAGWHPDVLGIIRAADDVSLYGMFDRFAEDSWHLGSVVLLGDAAHPILSSYAQGAGQAIEDAATLGTLLADAEPSEVGERLKLYELLRVPRVRRVQEVARSLIPFFNLPDGPEQRARDLAQMDPANNVYATSAWLYGFDAVTAAEQALRNRGI